MKEIFPEDSSGMVHGPDGPLRRTRANTLAGYHEVVVWPVGRNQAMIDEEGAWLSATFLENDQK